MKSANYFPRISTILFFAFGLFASGCCCLNIGKCPSNILVANDARDVNPPQIIERELIIADVAQVNQKSLCELKLRLGMIDDLSDCHTPTKGVEKCFCGSGPQKWTIPDQFNIEKLPEVVRGTTGSKLETDSLFFRNRTLELPKIDTLYSGKISKTQFYQDRWQSDDVEVQRVPPNIVDGIITGLVQPSKIKGYKDSDVIVAIMDTGIDMGSFKNREAKFLDTSAFNNDCNSIYDPGTGIAAVSSGWNFVDNNPDIGDKHSHGTLVTKLIVKHKGTKKRNFYLLPLKVFSNSGQGNSWNITCAFAYLSKLKSEYNYDIALLNASFGASVKSSDFNSERADLWLIKKYIDTLKSSTVVVTSAGNTGKNNDMEYYHFPSGFMSQEVFGSTFSNNVISTAGFVSGKTISLFGDSNRGKHSVNISAPWKYNMILSDELKLVGNILSNNPEGLDYASLQGTSYSAALVSSKVLGNLLKPVQVKRGNELRELFISQQQSTLSLQNDVKNGKYVKK